jgi:hypothetical protein
LTFGASICDTFSIDILLAGESSNGSRIHQLSEGAERRYFISNARIIMGDDKVTRECGTAYFRFACRGFRAHSPSRPPFSSMNSIPARSSAVRSALTASSETCRRSFSKSTTVESPNPAALASCDWDKSKKERAARHWAGVIFINNFC